MKTTILAARDAAVAAVTRQAGAAVAWGLANTSPSDVYGLRLESIALGGEEALMSDDVAAALGALDTACHAELSARRAVAS